MCVSDSALPCLLFDVFCILLQDEQFRGSNNIIDSLQYRVNFSSFGSSLSLLPKVHGQTSTEQHREEVCPNTGSHGPQTGPLTTCSLSV